MKKNIYLLVILAAILFSCKQNDVDPTSGNKVTITNEKVTNIDPTSVVVSGMYSYASNLDGIYVLVSASSDMANAKAFESVLNGKDFAATVTELKENTKYYYKYRYVNMGGALESEEVKDFTTIDCQVPTVITADVSEITGLSAKCGGEVTHDGYLEVTARGVCWSTSQNPTTGNNYTTDGSGTESFTSSITGLSENTTYYVRAYATNSAGTGYGEQIQFSINYMGDHEYVDLGLPSGLLWATCNVGAENPEDYGDYFAWGETSPKSNYDWSTYQWCNGSYKNLTKYCTQLGFGYNGFVDNNTVLEFADDAAHVNWGGDWRMPTKEEWQELKNNCNWTWTTMGGKSGYRVANKGDNNKYIFLPAAGCRNYTSLISDGSDGYYRSSSLYTSSPNSAYYLYFNSGSVDPQNYRSRGLGFSVRPVR